MKKLLFWSVLSLIMIFATSAISGDLIGPRVENQRLIGGSESFEDVSIPPAAPGGLITDSPGELVGETQYDYQTNGSSGNRLVIDNLGGKHFAWMKGIDYVGGLRSVYFNYSDASGNWPLPEGGQPVSQENGAGYTQISITSDDRAAVTYHESARNFVTYAEDQVSGFGIFGYFDPPDMFGLRCYWPYIALDRNDNIHIISVENAALGEQQTLGYTMSEDGGASWSRFRQVDTLMVISPNVVASPVSDKVAIVYTHPRDYTSQWYNDIYYIESEDGLTWDFANGKVNVTDYGSPDSLFAYTDLAAIYDHNDNLNIIWSAQWLTDEGIYYRTFLLHYSTGSGVITEILQTPSEWVDNCSFGVWNRPVTKMSLAAHPNAIFAVYTKFDTTDCSLGGFANGDIYATSSVDGGATWGWNEWPDTNLTNSPSPNCAAGNCDSDHWSSAADKVDDFLHIIYINDKDAGGVPQDEGAVTDNPVLYLKTPVPLTDIDDGHGVPTTFALSQNYPNPFNARTSIEFELLENSRVKLSVYDITGAKVATLVNGEMEAGMHSINWSADNVASGVYYYSLKTNGEGSTRKMTLLK